MTKKKYINAGLVQLAVKPGQVESNLATALEGIRALKARGVNLAVLPEMWSCGFDNKKLHIHAAKTPRILDKLSEWAFECKMIIAGSLPEYAAGNIYNTSYVIDFNGKLISSYRKIHLFSLTEEDKYFRSGKKLCIFETSFGPVGLMTCYDLRFPEHCRTLTLKGALMVIVSAQWPQMRIKHWDILLQARAIENQIFIAAANNCGHDQDTVYGGHSQIISPTGDILAIAERKACLKSAKIDFAEVAEFRNHIPCLKERMPDRYYV